MKDPRPDRLAEFDRIFRNLDEYRPQLRDWLKATLDDFEPYLIGDEAGRKLREAIGACTPNIGPQSKRNICATYDAAVDGDKL